MRDIGAVVVLDDLEFGGAALDELLDATPECAFLIAATPDVPAPSADSPLEEIVLGGLDRAGRLQLLERAVGRPLTEDEANWAGDLWFESEGLPLRFVQAGALLRQRDRQRAGADAVDEFGSSRTRRTASTRPSSAAAGRARHPPAVARRGRRPRRAARLPAELLGPRDPRSRSPSAARSRTRRTCPPSWATPTPTRPSASWSAARLVTPVGARYRLAAGVATQLEAAGYADDAETRARTAAQHYAWWAGHPSVTPERVSPRRTPSSPPSPRSCPARRRPARTRQSAAVVLARTPRPRSRRGCTGAPGSGRCGRRRRPPGSPARSPNRPTSTTSWASSRSAAGNLDRARAELEASIGLRGALADKRGTVAGRRALALVADRSGGDPARSGVRRRARRCRTPGTRSRRRRPAACRPRHADGLRPSARRRARRGRPRPLIVLRCRRPARSPHRPGAVAARRLSRLKGLVGGARRNLVAAGAGALLAAVLGTVVTLGATSDRDGDTPAEKVGVNPSAERGRRRRRAQRGPPQDGRGRRRAGCRARADRPGPRRHVRHVGRPGAHGQRGAVGRPERYGGADGQADAVPDQVLAQADAVRAEDESGSPTPDPDRHVRRRPRRPPRHRPGAGAEDPPPPDDTNSASASDLRPGPSSPAARQAPARTTAGSPGGTVA